MNLSYAGTHLSNGRSLNGSSCVVGLDQAGFIMGTSASLFNVSIIFTYSFKNSLFGPLAITRLCTQHNFTIFQK